MQSCNWQQGDIYYKPKTWFKNCNFLNWILRVAVFRLQFFFIGDEGLSQFFLVGGGGEKYVPPDPPTHLNLEQP